MYMVSWLTMHRLEMVYFEQSKIYIWVLTLVRLGMAVVISKTLGLSSGLTHPRMFLHWPKLVQF